MTRLCLGRDDGLIKVLHVMLILNPDVYALAIALNGPEVHCDRTDSG